METVIAAVAVAADVAFSAEWIERPKDVGTNECAWRRE